MKRLFLIFAACLLMVVLTADYAQAQITYGARAGVGLTSIFRKVDRQTDKNIMPIVGYQAAFLAGKDLPFFDDVFFGQVEISFATQGWENEITKTTTNLNYLRVSPMIEILPGFWNMYTQLGVYFGYAIGGETDNRKINFGKNADMKAFDFGSTAGVGFQFNSVKIGLLVQNSYVNFSNAAKVRERNTGMMLNLAYLF